MLLVSGVVDLDLFFTMTAFSDAVLAIVMVSVFIGSNLVLVVILVPFRSIGYWIVDKEGVVESRMVFLISKSRLLVIKFGFVGCNVILFDGTVLENMTELVVLFISELVLLLLNSLVLLSISVLSTPGEFADRFIVVISRVVFPGSMAPVIPICFQAGASEEKVRSVIFADQPSFPLRDLMWILWSHFSDSNPNLGVEFWPWTFQWDLTLHLLIWTVLHINRSHHQWFKGCILMYVNKAYLYSAKNLALRFLSKWSFVLYRLQQCGQVY